MKKCRWIKVDGEPCTLQALQGSDSCANHDPNGKYALQHPAYRARLLERIADGTDRTFIPRKGQCRALTRKGERCPNNGQAKNGYYCHIHDPFGKYAQQHPEFQARMLEDIQHGGPRERPW